MDREILEIFAYLSLDILLEVLLFDVFLSNYTDMYCLKDLLSLFILSLFQIDL